MNLKTKNKLSSYNARTLIIARASTLPHQINMKFPLFQVVALENQHAKHSLKHYLLFQIYFYDLSFKYLKLRQKKILHFS